jgi:hypothetical protein
MGETNKLNKIMVIKCPDKRKVEKYRYKWQDNIKTYLGNMKESG